MPRAAGGCRVLRRIRGAGLVTLAALGRRHLCTMRAVWRKNAVKSREVSPGNMKTQSSCEKVGSGLGHQGDESGLT